MMFDSLYVFVYKKKKKRKERYSIEKQNKKIVSDIYVRELMSEYIYFDGRKLLENKTREQKH